MPELPEVETIKRDLAKNILNKTIKDVFIYDSRVIRNCSPRLFVKRNKGKKITAVERRGKAIIIGYGSKNGKLVVQLMMTGQLIYSAENLKPPGSAKLIGSAAKRPSSITKVTFLLSNNHYLHYNDQRLFGRLSIVDDLNEIKYFQIIGPEPFSSEFSAGWLEQELPRRKMPIKTLLMNHCFVAGIGNIYASEILFRCRINPIRPANSLQQSEIKDLYRNIIAVLKEAIKYRGTSMNTYRDSYGKKGNFFSRLKVYGRADGKCFQCQAPIEKIVLSGRSTFYCNKCQK